MYCIFIWNKQETINYNFFSRVYLKRKIYNRENFEVCIYIIKYGYKEKFMKKEEGDNLHNKFNSYKKFIMKCVKFMDYIEFSENMKKYMKDIGIEISEDKLEKFYKYMLLLIEWNKMINLTAIIEPEDIIIKHFIDSLTISKYIKNEHRIIDIGTGAGFPGIPISILKDKCNIVLMDSLNKRINFLNEVIVECGLQKTKTVHARAEEMAKDKLHREMYNIATSRAVANMAVLLEYMLPFVEVGGYAICMKGVNIQDEIQSCKKALEILGGEIVQIDNFQLPGTDFGRNIVVVKKVKKSPVKFPRKAGLPTKEPLI